MAVVGCEKSAPSTLLMKWLEREKRERERERERERGGGMKRKEERGGMKER